MADNIATQLSRILAGNAKSANGKTLRQNLEDAISYLYECVDKYIQEYYVSYYPKVYERTYMMRESLYAEDFVHARLIGNKLSLSVSFMPSGAYHPNLWGDHESYVPILINSGWNAKKLEAKIGRSVPRLTHYEGYHFIEKAVKYFNKTNTYGVYIAPQDVEITWHGQPVDLKW